MNIQNKKWFTLVELIVVITILSVLATIWFISFAWYQTSARDSVRLSDIHNIETWLWIQKIKAGKYPIPDEKVNINLWWTTLNYQWYAWASVLWLIWLNGEGKDPLLWEYYTYSTNVNRVKYQILSYFENQEHIKKQAFAWNAYAQISELYPKLKWDKLGIIINNSTKEPLQKSGMDINISDSTSVYEVYLWDNEIITWSDVSLWSLYSKSSCKRLKEFDSSLLDGKYMIDPLANWNEIEVLCDMTSDWGGWTLYTAKNKYEYPDTWYFSLDPLKQSINFSEIRWNFVSPQWKHLPLIYSTFNQNEWKFILEHNEWIQDSIYIDENNHYKTPKEFANAFYFGENDTSGVSLLVLQEAYENYNMTHLWAWVDGLWRNISFLWTAYWYNKSIIKNLFRFPSNPYNGTYKMWEETFMSISNNASWQDGRSISIWIK